MKKLERNPALDLVRIVATLCVISVHFFINSGFYDTDMIGTRMYLMGILRNFFMICVPLFMVLTGYLMNKKILSRRYYFGIIKTLAIYTIASLACYLFTNKSIAGFLRELLKFKAAQYSWYIEMYIGLFLLIPFLNVMYRGDNSNLSNKKYKQALVITLLMTTAVPDVIETYMKIFPGWWGRLYPITYYIIGCYLSEFGLRLRKRTCVLILICISVASGTLAFCRADGGIFIWEDWSDHASIIVACQAILTFHFVSSLKLEKLSTICKRLLAETSNLCLGIYLVSQIFDVVLYQKLNQIVHGVGARFMYFPIMVSAVFLCSLALSAVIELVYVLLSRFCSCVKSKAGRRLPIGR